MVIAIVIALVVTCIIIALTHLIERKLSPNPIPGDWVWVVWVVAIIMICLVWWRLVIGQFVGPLP